MKSPVLLCVCALLLLLAACNEPESQVDGDADVADGDLDRDDVPADGDVDRDADGDIDKDSTEMYPCEVALEPYTYCEDDSYYFCFQDSYSPGCPYDCRSSFCVYGCRGYYQYDYILNPYGSPDVTLASICMSADDVPENGVGYYCMDERDLHYCKGDTCRIAADCTQVWNSDVCSGVNIVDRWSAPGKARCEESVGVDGDADEIEEEWVLVGEACDCSANSVLICDDNAILRCSPREIEGSCRWHCAESVSCAHGCIGCGRHDYIFNMFEDLSPLVEYEPPRCLEENESPPPGQGYFCAENPEYIKYCRADGECRYAMMCQDNTTCVGPSVEDRDSVYGTARCVTVDGDSDEEDESVSDTEETGEVAED